LESAPENEKQKELHLIDFGNVVEVAQWMSSIILGLATSAIYELTKGAFSGVGQQLLSREEG